MARKFRGSEEVKVDGKGRMSIPARFRRIFEAGDPDWKPSERTRMIVVYGPESWKKLEFYTVDAADRIDEEIDRLPRGSQERLWLETLMNGMATEAEIDTDGRLVLPQKLRDKIGLDNEAFFTSKGDFVEVWNPENYSEASGTLQEFMERFPDGFDPRSFLGNAPIQDPREG
ncbi:division/cell wall cluster transcriptional repressor MraZ [Paracoccus aerodenitrificans]|uniref:division/cell wall cluster transcriptional repressor MraZ n=1 Tax=Paracoccus aerodenitrificans TaxID=3017781 RepID=UPI0022F05F54|nr:division/cell wall cluster transcriptional repressor MraZ [Paracoccus aerodenitrificans]WBU63150.1 division/cell wall cluster transcriptional repressor MraZ [Paracoccus aerodenitrificans]